MSSYANFDHAAWMQREIEAIRLRKPKMTKILPTELSEFQKRVVNIIGIVGDGIYNAPINTEKIDWNYGGGVSVNWHRELSTWDFNKLTTFVFLCHEARIRVQIESTGPRSTKISFWQRKKEGQVSVRHPNLDEAIAEFRMWFKPDNQINYKEETEEVTFNPNSVAETVQLVHETINKLKEE